MRHKRSRSKSQPRENSNSNNNVKRKKSRRGPTDSDIEKTYTGMDRDLAEEFIEQTMEQSGGATADQTVSGTESEAW